MKIRFTGTGYGKSACKKPLTKEYRRKSSLLVDDTLLIDPTEDTLDFELTFALGGLYAQVTDVLITHSLPQAFSAETLQKLSAKHPIRVYGNKTVTEKLAGIPGVTPMTLAPFSVGDVGAFRVIALPAALEAAPGEIAYFYAICKEKAFIYAPVGALFPKESFKILKNIRFSAAVLGAPLGDDAPDERIYDALSYDAVLAEKKLLLSSKIITETTPVYLTSLPFYKKREYHRELTEIAPQDGFTVPYDGYFTTV